MYAVRILTRLTILGGTLRTSRPLGGRASLAGNLMTKMRTATRLDVVPLIRIHSKSVLITGPPEVVSEAKIADGHTKAV